MMITEAFANLAINSGAYDVLDTIYLTNQLRRLVGQDELSAITVADANLYTMIDTLTALAESNGQLTRLGWTKDMFEAAKKHVEERTFSATDMDSFAKQLEETPGFIKAMWCGDEACELKIKELTGASLRCIPFEQEKISDKCVCCSKPASKMVYWGKAY